MGTLGARTAREAWARGSATLRTCGSGSPQNQRQPVGTLQLGGLRRGLAVAKGHSIPGDLQSRAWEQQVQQECRAYSQDHSLSQGTQSPERLYTEARTRLILERQGSPLWQARPVRATRNRYPEGGTYPGKKRKTLLRALAPLQLQGLSDLQSPFLGRGYGAHRPQQTHTKVGLELAGDTQGDKLAEPSPERGRTSRPLRLDAGVRGRAGKATLPASPQHFYGGGDWGGALTRRGEGERYSRCVLELNLHGQSPFVLRR